MIQKSHQTVWLLLALSSLMQYTNSQTSSSILTVPPNVWKYKINYHGYCNFDLKFMYVVNRYTHAGGCSLDNLSSLKKKKKMWIKCCQHEDNFDPVKITDF